MQQTPDNITLSKEETDFLLFVRKNQIAAEQKARQMEGIRRKIESGEHYGAAPIGYINRREGNRTWIEEDPEVGPLVREAFELVASGKSLRFTLETMRTRGLLGGRGGILGLSSLGFMLRNTAYEKTGLVDSQTFAKAQARLWEKRKGICRSTQRILY